MDIREFAGKQRERSEQNNIAVATWIYRWGWTTLELLQRVTGLKRPSLGLEFVKKGILERVDAPPGYRERHAYILAPRGLEVAQMSLDSYYGYLPLMPYTLHESRRIPWSIHAHQCVCQHLVIDILGQRPDPMSYTTESEQRGIGGESAPDFTIVLDDQLLLCEVELNQKSEMRYKRWLYARAKDIQKKDSARCVIFTHLNAIAATLQKILRQKELYQIVRDPLSGKLRERADKAGIPLADIREKFEVRMLVKDPDRRSGELSIAD